MDIDDDKILLISALFALYFGVQTLRILPTVVRLIGAIGAGKATWPGPETHDPARYARQAREILGDPPEYLFPTFFKHALGVVAAFALSVLNALNWFFLWMIPLPGQELIAFGLPLLIVAVGGHFYLRRALHNATQIKGILSKLR